MKMALNPFNIVIDFEDTYGDIDHTDELLLKEFTKKKDLENKANSLEQCYQLITPECLADIIAVSNLIGDRQ